MKLFWKQFIVMMCVIILSFMIFGNILMYTAFQTMLNRETERGIEELKTYQYALVASLEGLPEDYQATDLAVSQIAASLMKNLNSDQDGVVVYNKKKKVIYQNSRYQSELIRKIEKVPSGVWQIVRRNGHYYLETLCKIKSSTENYTLEIHRNIDHIYQDRTRLYDRYIFILIFVSAVFTVVLFLISMHFTRPIRRLSQVAQAFADGDFKKRVKEKGNDEVAVLSRDFNRMAGQLESNIWELEENARRQEEFTEAFSHELKTPLTSIIGYADMLRSIDMSREDISLSANYIFQQGKRLERLALKMMELTYVDKQEIRFQEMAVSVFMENIRAMTEKMLKEKEISFLCEAEEGNLYGDPDLLTSLFLNLIDNARKACDIGGNIVWKGMCTEDGYCFTIRDDGQGIPKEEIQNITEAFYMVDKSRARKEGGAGMGMALCQKIIQRHQAEWTIQSRLGEGTEIYVRFFDFIGKSDKRGGSLPLANFERRVSQPPLFGQRNQKEGGSRDEKGQ